jgi:hypothetical protein
MSLTPAQAAEALSQPVNALGRAFMLHETTRRRAKDEHGLRGRPMYHLGRGGALGDVPADVVIAAFAFFPPDVVRAAWQEGRLLMAPPDAARVYAGYCADWGREHLTAASGVERAVELVERVVDAAEPAGLPLFAGWRLLPRPDDAVGRLALLLHVLREHRGAVHVAAVAAVGLDPLAAVCAGRYGPDNARFFEWPEPYPDPEPHRARWDAAEDLTAAGAALAYDALSAPERAELVELVTAIHSATLG